MICKNCGKELNDDFKMCPYCGAPVGNGENIEPVLKETNKNEKKPIDKKIIAIIGAIVLVVIIAVVVIIAANKNNNNSSGAYNNDTPTYSYDENEDDDFGNNEDVTAIETEAPTASSVDNIELVYDDIIYGRDGSEEGAIEITNYNMVRNSNGSITIYIDFKKVKDSEYEDSSFAVDAYFYDANGTPIGDQQTCYVPNFGEGEIGKKYKDEINLYNSDGTADATVKVEIIGG